MITETETRNGQPEMVPALPSVIQVEGRHVGDVELVKSPDLQAIMNDNRQHGSTSRSGGQES
jgi:hypothetical protein